MSAPMTGIDARPANTWRSIGAVVAGFVAVFVLSTVVDVILHLVHVYPPWDQPISPGASVLALSYRTVITIIGAYLTAKLAPRNPMRHALALGVVGTIAGAIAAIITIPMHMGPSWYPIALAVEGLPCCWIGGLLYLSRHPENR